METEAKIVYSIINTAKKGLNNDDARLGERVIRSFLATYRGQILRDESFNGNIISEEAYQDLGTLSFTYLKSRQYKRKLPKIIRLKDAMGIMIEKYDENIPVLSSEEFNLGLKSIINGFIPKAKFLSNEAVIFIGKKRITSCGHYEPLNEFVDLFEEELVSGNGKEITAQVKAILDNPDDCLTYDWTKDPYPFPSEMIPDLVKEILRTEFNIILQVNTDKISDGNEQDN